MSTLRRTVDQSSDKHPHSTPDWNVYFVNQQNRSKYDTLAARNSPNKKLKWSKWVCCCLALFPGRLLCPAPRTVCSNSISSSSTCRTDLWHFTGHNISILPKVGSAVVFWTSLYISEVWADSCLVTSKASVQEHLSFQGTNSLHIYYKHHLETAQHKPRHAT